MGGDGGPKLVRSVGPEGSLDPVFGSEPHRIGGRRFLLAARNSLQDSGPHEPFQGTARDPALLPPMLAPDFVLSATTMTDCLHRGSPYCSPTRTDWEIRTLWSIAVRSGGAYSPICI